MKCKTPNGNVKPKQKQKGGKKKMKNEGKEEKNL
jgi:hypothetical protein